MFEQFDTVHEEVDAEIKVHSRLWWVYIIATGFFSAYNELSEGEDETQIFLKEEIARIIKNSDFFSGNRVSNLAKQMPSVDETEVKTLSTEILRDASRTISPK